ncbi:ATP-binding cassette domain-containing protein [Paenibacillus alvei]|uniref:ATP-binding cassette domain-containing protein n=1 Tax=Paenibacillus alvei TaxID=44250 RepID=UPI00227EE187|nr:ABC transporter ATP-binding protein [Paenibacillus alvei]
MRILQSKEVMRAERVAFTYFGESEPVLQPCSFCIKSGSVVLLAGGNGSGKTTLLKLMAGAMQSHEGQQQGELSCGMVKDGQAPIRGFILQEAKEQFVIGTVEDELAFAPENLGLPREVIHSRVEEQLDKADLRQLRLRQVQQLSGGEQQRTAVASVLTMEPDVLLIDDAWSQMDKESRRRLLEQLRAWHSKGRTIVLAASRLDELSDEWQHGWIQDAQLLLLHNGRMVYDGKMPVYPARGGLNGLSSPKDELRCLELCYEAGIIPPKWEGNAETTIMSMQVPATVKQGSAGDDAAVRAECAGGECSRILEEEVLLHLSKVSYRYHPIAHRDQKRRQTEDALHNVTFQLKAGRCMLLTGKNGSGKSTLFRLITGGLSKRSGSMEGEWWIAGQLGQKLRSCEVARLIGFTAQQPESGFFAASVQEELRDALHAANQCGRLRIEGQSWEGHAVYTHEQVEREVESRLQQYCLWEVKHLHPHDMPTGLKRLLSLAIASAHEPEVILLDEPTASLDAVHAAFVRDWCLRQAEQGRALIVATHDRMWEEVEHPRLMHANMDRGSLHINL